MSVLYVTEQGASLHRARQRLSIKKGGHVLKTMRFDDLEQVVICGNVQVSAHALRSFLQRSLDVSFMTLGGRYLGKLTAPGSGNIELRRQQYRKIDNEQGFRLDIASTIVAGKLKNQRALLLRNSKKAPKEVTRAVLRLRRLRERAIEARNLETLRGFEGSGASAYFSVFSKLLKVPGMEFQARLKRPPPDPVNILLSFGYTLLTHLVHGYIELAGMDPYLGCLHDTAYGRPSLALDLIEEFRPVIVDAAVLRVVNTRAIGPSDFIRATDEDPVVEEEWEREELESSTDPGKKPSRRILLTPLGTKKWFAMFERRLSEKTFYPRLGVRLAYRQVLREQVYRFARRLKQEDDYLPYEFKA